MSLEFGMVDFTYYPNFYISILVALAATTAVTRPERQWSSCDKKYFRCSETDLMTLSCNLGCKWDFSGSVNHLLQTHIHPTASGSSDKHRLRLD